MVKKVDRVKSKDGPQGGFKNEEILTTPSMAREAEGDIRPFPKTNEFSL